MTISGFARTAAAAAHRCLRKKCVSAPWTGSGASDLTEDRRKTLRAARHLATQTKHENCSHSFKENIKTFNKKTGAERGKEREREESENCSKKRKKRKTRDDDARRRGEKGELNWVK